MSAKHTPGPWLIDADDLRQDPETVFSIGIWSGNTQPYSESSTMVATVSAFGLHSETHDGCEYVTTAEPEQREIDIAIANAHLIKAAPDLLEALTELLTDMKIAQANMRSAARRDPSWEGCAEAIQPRVDAAHAAILKATGASA